MSGRRVRAGDSVNPLLRSSLFLTPGLGSAHSSVPVPCLHSVPVGCFAHVAHAFAHSLTHTNEVKSGEGNEDEWK